MKYRVKVKIGWSGKTWYVLQQKIWFFWINMHNYESLDAAQLDCDDFNKTDTI